MGGHLELQLLPGREKKREKREKREKKEKKGRQVHFAFTRVGEGAPGITIIARQREKERKREKKEKKREKKKKRDDRFILHSPELGKGHMELQLLPGREKKREKRE